MYHSLVTVFLLAALTSAQSIGPVFNSSFTWYTGCEPSHVPACGPSYQTVAGQATAAVNMLLYNGGKACGQCWHLQPQHDPFPTNGNQFGTPVVVKVADSCGDGGYCDQTTQHPLNTGYQEQVHFDLCVASGVADQFFANRDNFGVLTGLAQQVDCSALGDGTFGSALGQLE